MKFADILTRLSKWKYFCNKHFFQSFEENSDSVMVFYETHSYRNAPDKMDSMEKGIWETLFTTLPYTTSPYGRFSLFISMIKTLKISAVRS